MAEIAAVLGFLLNNLKKLAVHFNLMKNAQDELDQLERDLETMKRFLKNASMKTDQEEQFKASERDFREIVYEVEDTIERAYTAAKSTNPLKWTGNLSRAKKVESLRRTKVKPALEKAPVDFGNLPVAHPPVGIITENAITKWTKAPRKDKVVGFQDENDRLIKFITDASINLEVISIVGMPGLGKTTMASKIFNDPRITDVFPTLIWVHVSQEFNKRDMLITILRKFAQEDMSSNPIKDLIRRVYENLERGKFLIVMDDVWTNAVWDELEELLPMSNNSGRVLMTTRHENVALHANRGREPHKLKFLTEGESWELLRLEVFNSVDNFPAELENIGKDIARQCDGLPLAIIVIGGILVRKLSTTGGINGIKKEWKRISEDSVNTCLIHDDQGRHVAKMIRLSYKELPCHLRDCFLYLGMFPEDTELPSQKLIQLWIAEGFIQPKPNKSLEEVARDNLKDLINMNLVMVDKIKPNGEVKTCHVHGTVREFCGYEASFANQNFFQEVKMSKQGVFHPPIGAIHKYHRLCIHSSVKELFQKKMKASKARSLICISKEPIILENKDIAIINTTFHLLRILDATIKFIKFPKNVKLLTHLRYITLSSDKLSIIPKTISKLRNLQTLIVDTSAHTLKVNASIWALVQLRHLKTKASIILRKGKGEGCEHLQTLGRLSPQSCTDEVFSKAKNLNKLGIRGDLSKILGSISFQRLQDLEKLTLVHDVFSKVASQNSLNSLPEPENFPSNLNVLTLSDTFLDWSHMEKLGTKFLLLRY